MISSKIQTPLPRKELIDGALRALTEKSEGRTEELLWLDKNESIDPEYSEFIQKIIPTIASSVLYAYPDLFTLYDKLAKYLKVERDELLVAAGSDSVIRAVFETFIMPGDVVIYPEPTFLMYSLYSKIYGANNLVLNYQPSASGPILTVETMVHAIEGTSPRLVCLPNPGSPTGTIFKLNELREIIEAAGKAGAVMLVDEAYHPFYSETVISWITEYPHLIVSRSFSKAWGLAGIRLGYGVACNELMKELQKVRPRYEVGNLTATIAEKILAHADIMLDSVQRLNRGKQFFLNEMKGLGFHTLNGEGNFLHIAFGDQAAAIHDVLSEKVLYQKDFKHPALAGYSRFTSTTKELFLPIVNIIKNVMN